MNKIEEYEKKYGAVSIHICTKDRAGELSLLLQSLRTQTYKKWNIIILCDGSLTNTFHNIVVAKLINRIRLEGHKIKTLRNGIPGGPIKARNKIIENDNYTDDKLICRFDDDVIPESDYMEKLIDGIELGYDFMSGITPSMETPEMKRKVSFVSPVINEIKFDTEGNITQLNDDCGYSYIEDVVLPTHQFRSGGMLKRELYDSGLRYEQGITLFREEGFFTARAIFKGFKIGVHTGAKIFHFMNPSGGCRDLYSSSGFDDMSFRMWMKREYQKRGNFLKAYDEKLEKEGLLKRGKNE